MIIEAINSAETGGGSFVKYAVKLPNRLTVRVAAGSSVNASRSATNANGESEDAGAETFLVRIAAGSSEKVSRSVSNRESGDAGAETVLVELPSKI